MNRSSCAIIFALCVLLASRPGPAAAQSTPLRDPLSFDWGLGLLWSIPEEFDRRPCDSFFGLEARVGVELEVAATLAVESSLAVTVPRSQQTTVLLQRRLYFASGRYCGPWANPDESRGEEPALGRGISVPVVGRTDAMKRALLTTLAAFPGSRLVQ